MRQSAAQRLSSRAAGSILLTILVGLLGLALLAFLSWFLACPCERTPGSHLRGERVLEPVSDWTFANDVRLCQIQVRTRPLPHAVNLNCMATEAGHLYLSCAQCEGKRWSTAALADPRARLRLDDRVYPVHLSRVTDAEEKDLAWRTRSAKLQRLRGEEVDEAPPRPEDDAWWTFRVEHASG